MRRRIGKRLTSAGINKIYIDEVSNLLVPKPPSIMKIVKEYSKVDRYGRHK
jgi:hypothetical protein